MSARSALKWVFAFGVLAIAAGPAAAQPAPQPSGTTTVTAQPPGSGPTDGQVGFQRKATLSPNEQVTEGTRHIQKMEGANTGVKKTLEQARRQRDVVRTLCLTDKASQVDTAIKSGKDRHELLKQAAARNDVELANHQYTILTVLRQRTEQVAAEANQCIGEESAFLGDTRTSVQVDPDIPPDEAPYPLTDPTLVITAPQCTSCTQ